MEKSQYMFDTSRNSQKRTAVRFCEARMWVRNSMGGFLALLLLVLALYPQEAQAAVIPSETTWTVAPTGGNFTTIGQAINAVPVGATIYIKPGTYRESFTIYKEVHLMGVGNRSSIIIEDASPVYFNAAKASIRNVTIRSNGPLGSEDEFYAVRINGGQIVLEECDISGGQFNIAIYVFNHGDPSIRDNTIHNGMFGILTEENSLGTFEGNNITMNFGGVGVLGGSNPTFRNNEIHGNLFTNVGILESSQGIFENNNIYVSIVGIGVSDDSNPMIRLNQIHNHGDDGITLYEKARGTYSRNDIYANGGAGIVVQDGSMPVVDKNRISYNSAYGISVNTNGDGTFTNNDLTNNSQGAWEIKDDAGQITASGNQPK